MVFFSSFLTSLRSLTLESLFDRLFRILLVVLPFHVLLTVFMEYKVGISQFTLYKEILLAIMMGIIGYAWYKKRIQIQLNRLDFLIFAYIGWLVIVTLFYPSPLEHLAYGGRYNFEFLLAFLTIRFGIPLLAERPMYYVRLFLLSGSLALVLGILVRWVFGETILLHFGFSANLSNWMFGGSIPIYHGIDQANVRRFQGIFDGPNPAGFFILLYFGMLAAYYKSAKKYHYLLSLWGIILIGVLFYTYSRSALLGFIAGVGMLILLNIPFIWKKFRPLLLWAIPIFFLLSGLFYLKFESTIHQIVLREWSTKGHFERAITGIERAMDRPLGSGLASAGPAYRFVQQPEENESLFVWENKTKEDYYIPESWFIQQLVEGGIIGFALFVAILGRILLILIRRNIFVAAAFIGMCTMNLFLHSFESIYISLLLFMLLALICFYDTPRIRQRAS